MHANVRVYVHRHSREIFVNYQSLQSIELFQDKLLFLLIDQEVGKDLQRKKTQISPNGLVSGITWELISQCIDQVWNSLNIILSNYSKDRRRNLFISIELILVCNSPFDIVNPTSFFPYCYQINQQTSLISQLNAIQDCSDKSAQLVWFQSVDEIQQQLIPALIVRGLARG